MAARSEIVSQLVEALKAADIEAGRAMLGHFADGVVLASPMGSVQGKEAVRARLDRVSANSLGGMGAMAMGVMGRVRWGAPEPRGAGVVVEASLPSGLPLPFPIRGVEIHFSFDASDRVTRVDLSLRM